MRSDNITKMISMHQRTTMRRSTYATPACGNNEAHVCTSRGTLGLGALMKHVIQTLNIGRIMEGTEFRSGPIKRTRIGSLATVFSCCRCSMPTHGQRLLAEALLPDVKGLLCIILLASLRFPGEKVFQCFYRKNIDFIRPDELAGVGLDETTCANAVGKGWMYVIEELVFKNSCNEALLPGWRSCHVSIERMGCREKTTLRPVLHRRSCTALVYMGPIHCGLGDALTKGRHTLLLILHLLWLITF